MTRSRTLSLALAVVLIPSLAFAQEIDALAEGTTATVLALANGVTLRDLDTGLGTAPDAFFVDDATGALLQYDAFSVPGNHVVSFGGFTPGPDNLYGRCKSFRIALAPQVLAVYFDMWFSRADAGNSVMFDYRVGGVSQFSEIIPIAPGTAPFHVYFNPINSPGGLDEIVITGSGPLNGGAFHGVIDGFFVDTIVDFAPTCVGSQGAPVACPCGNGTTPYDPEGCAHSFGYGARLRMSGEPLVSNDTLQLVCMQLPPNSPAMFFQGTQHIGSGLGAVFGDGKRCAGGTTVRLATKVSANGFATYPEPGDAPISVQGQIPGVAVRTYQVWYRSAASFCTSATYNLSNGLHFGWSP